MQERRTALVVEVPEAEPVVGAIRLELDPVAGLGVPAHVTVLYPFVPAAGMDDDVLSTLASAIGPEPPFAFTLTRTAWFGEKVLWLAPDATARFRTLTSRVWRDFPQHPPYGGRFDEVVPHLTVGDRAPVEAMRDAELTLRDHLPIEGAARAVTLLVEATSGRWNVAAKFPLRGSGG